ncbi:hypothetical protein [Metallosphaera hakonensis]|uniref:hypothetical protein n=1 Tax=Metallosphaera hakonensis TaxID=79601 RepID=UPI000A4644F0|nr:hypothetical protein [Metallosphaera hakonensis]
MFFGSYTREDYVEGISDINVFALSDRKEVLLELASLGFSPVILNETQLKIICESGEPLCYHLLYDSRIICGKIPDIHFKTTHTTCQKLLQYSRSQAKLSLGGLARQDEISSTNNLYRGIRSYIMSQCCKDGVIPLSDSEVMECCRSRIGGEVCELFATTRDLRRNKKPVTYWTVRRFVTILEKETN